MNPSVRGVVLGLVTLAVFDAVVSHQGAASAVGGIWKFANTALEKFMSPAIGFFAASSNASSSTPAPSPTGASAAGLGASAAGEGSPFNPSGFPAFATPGFTPR